MKVEYEIVAVPEKVGKDDRGWAVYEAVIKKRTWDVGFFCARKNVKEVLHVCRGTTAGSWYSEGGKQCSESLSIMLRNALAAAKIFRISQ